MSDLFEKARAVRLNAHAPYSKFRVGAALRTKTGKEFVGCNVENSAYPQGTCAEAGAIAAMIAAGEKEIAEICIVADSPSPISPCGGCRQKLAEFSNSSTPVHLANLEGILASHNLGDLLPHSFSSDHLPNG
jgi:cytidine deaminase